ncbi:MAG TPA: ATP-binding protein [Terracidiphilus sp.]|nr:ATP-binding protein [Terracidiphilus sp.]
MSSADELREKVWEPKEADIQAGARVNYKTPVFEHIEAQAYRRHLTAFSLLTLSVIAALLVLHTYYAPLLGEPSRPVILLLGVGFFAKVAEAIWLQSRREGVSQRTAQMVSALTVGGFFLLTGLLAFVSKREDTPYIVLLAIPILQCAYHFSLIPTVLTISAASAMIFAWIHHYFVLYPPAVPAEYLEAGMICVIFWLMGLLVWYLVQQLRQRQMKLFENLEELAATRERLFEKEKLALVGRFASGVAHEIRNPVAMIASSMATANHPAADAREREEMLAIAAREAKRLEKLTEDFLTYARPSKPRQAEVEIGDILRHVTDVTRLRAVERSIKVECALTDALMAEVDASQVEGALLNLCLNAVDATPASGRIELKAHAEDNRILIEIENTGTRIEEAAVARIFEPFFTTKASGTGLGLAIAKSVAVAHGGDVWLSTNRDGLVAFSMMLTAHAAQGEPQEQKYGQSADC